MGNFITYKDNKKDVNIYKKGGWIQKQTASIKRRGTEGVCTGSKFGSQSCPAGSKRYNLQKTFKKMAKKRKHQEGGLITFQQKGKSQPKPIYKPKLQNIIVPYDMYDAKNAQDSAIAKERYKNVYDMFYNALRQDGTLPWRSHIAGTQQYLNDNIQNIITRKDPNLDAIHQSFNNYMTDLKNNMLLTNKQLISVAEDPYNNFYDTLSETDKKRVDEYRKWLKGRTFKKGGLITYKNEI